MVPQRPLATSRGDDFFFQQLFLYLRCHKEAWQLLQGRGCGRFTPSSSESERGMLLLGCAPVVRGPAQAAAETCRFAGILVSSHGISETR